MNPPALCRVANHQSRSLVLSWPRTQGVLLCPSALIITQTALTNTRYNPRASQELMRDRKAGNHLVLLSMLSAQGTGRGGSVPLGTAELRELQGSATRALQRAAGAACPAVLELRGPKAVRPGCGIGLRGSGLRAPAQLRTAHRGLGERSAAEAPPAGGRPAAVAQSVRGAP